MKYQRIAGMVLAMVAFLAVSSQASAQFRGAVVLPAGGPNFGGFGGGFGGSFGGGFGGSYWYYGSYATPSYTIWPAPFMTVSSYGIASARISAEPAPRARASMYPAIPFGKETARKSELQRICFEVTVPCASATVTIDGLVTKQTGLSRSFMTPPLETGTTYESTIVVHWTDAAGMPRTQQQTFTAPCGAVIQHTFVE